MTVSVLSKCFCTLKVSFINTILTCKKTFGSESCSTINIVDSHLILFISAQEKREYCCVDFYREHKSGLCLRKFLI